MPALHLQGRRKRRQRQHCEQTTLRTSQTFRSFLPLVASFADWAEEIKGIADLIADREKEGITIDGSAESVSLSEVF
jgi:hypothetical protein